MKTNGYGFAAQVAASDNEAVRDLISRAIHDLREPLRAIRLGAQLLTTAHQKGGEEDAARGTHYIEDSLDRMETLIHALGDYCYASVGDSAFCEIDLESVLREVEKELVRELKGVDATVTHDPLPAVLGDAPSLAAVFRSLISNACRFQGDAPPRIHVGVERQGAEWIFSVRDNGLGFDPIYSERIFRPFERLHGRRYPGSGLGLSVAKTLVEKHRGRIWAESRSGEGSTFGFSLPG